MAGATFSGADADGSTAFRYPANWESAKLDFITPPRALLKFDQFLVDQLETANNIERFRLNNNDPVALLANELTDYGRQTWGIFAASAAIILLFGAVYAIAYEPGADTYSFKYLTFLDFIVMSAQRFVNASPGFSSDVRWLEIAFTSEGALGYILLSLFVAVFLKKLVSTR